MNRPLIAAGAGLVLALLLNTALNAQIPNGYYNTAIGLTGNKLKASLHHIIKGHTEYPYTSASSTDVWDILKETDRDTANPANVILIYSGLSVNAAQEYNSGSGWTREHVWAKSHGSFGTSPGPGTDVHHLRPENNTINTLRNNRWFANSDVPVYYNNQFTGCYKGSDDWTWEPRDAVKGDIARMIFYMATRYEGHNGEPDLELVDYLPDNNNTAEPIHARLSDLIVWHNLDPVDGFERHRNEVIFGFQHNRNPFIDHPEYVGYIWTNDSLTEMPPVIAAITQTPQNPTSADEVTVTARVTDNDENLCSVDLLWGTSRNDLNKSTPMDFNGSSHQAVIPAYSDNDSIYFKVVAVDAASNTTTSELYSYTIRVSDSVISTMLSEVRVYPNPFNSTVNVEVDNTEICYLQIFNLVGSQVYSCYIQGNKQIYLTQIPSGAYILRLQRGKQTHSLMLVKQ